MSVNNNEPVTYMVDQSEGSDVKGVATSNCVGEINFTFTNTKGSVTSISELLIARTACSSGI